MKAHNYRVLCKYQNPPDVLTPELELLKHGRLHETKNSKLFVVSILDYEPVLTSEFVWKLKINEDHRTIC